MTDPTVIAINLLRRDGGTQPRSEFKSSVAEEYAEAMVRGAVLPPVVAFYDGAEYWLADGFHRVAAYEYSELDHIEVDVRQGTQRDAVLYSVGANAAHGQPRTNEDKRRAVNRLLNDPEWSGRSDNWIAKACAVSAPLVAAMRPPTINSYSGEVRTFQTADGNVSHMKVGNIGRAKPSLPVIAGKLAERKPRPDAAGLQEEVDLGGASAITGLSPRNVAELARDGMIEGAKKESGYWTMPTKSVVALVVPAETTLVAPDEEPAYDHDAGQELVVVLDAISTIAAAANPSEFLAKWQADLGSGLPVETVARAGAWMAEFSQQYPAVEAARQARLTAMYERIEEDVVTG